MTRINITRSPTTKATVSEFSIVPKEDPQISFPCEWGMTIKRSNIKQTSTHNGKNRYIKQYLKMRIQRRLLTKAVSTCGQGEENPEFWFATQEGKMSIFYLASSGLLALAPQEKHPLLHMHIRNLFLTKLVWSTWLHIGLVLFFFKYFRHFYRL